MKDKVFWEDVFKEINLIALWYRTTHKMLNSLQRTTYCFNLGQTELDSHNYMYIILIASDWILSYKCNTTLFSWYTCLLAYTNEAMQTGEDDK